MFELSNWQGRTEEMSISYEVGVNGNALLPAEFKSSNLPAIYYGKNDGVCDVIEEEWESKVKKADKIDYAIAVACGAIAGLVDSFWVGKLSIERANKWGDENVNSFVEKVARRSGYKGEGLEGAIRFMENQFPLASDSNTSDFGGGRQHHLRDFSHHCSIGGILCSLFTQFTGKVIGTGTDGKLQIVEVEDKSFIGKNFEDKVFYGTIDWIFHIVSDMAGSNQTVGRGTGVPGPIVSLMKELSVLPCFKDKQIDGIEFRKWISKLFNGTLLAKRDKNGKIVEPAKFDLRTEIGILHELSRQMVPVLINECLVRGLYFVRRLYIAFKENEICSVSELKKINVAELLPTNNRVISRMITIASGTFTAVDTVDAAIRSAIKNKGINQGFVTEFVLRINYVGIGRFVIACKADFEYMVEDVKTAGRDKAVNQVDDEYEQNIADLKCLSLDSNQLRILYSLEKLIVSDDIADTENKTDRTLKQKWASIWQNSIVDNLPILEEDKLSFFMNENDIVTYIITHNTDKTWIHLVAMEAMLFNPYFPLGGNEEDKSFERLRCKSDYFVEKFTKRQSYITKEVLTDLKKAYKSACGKITGSTKNLMIGGVGTAAAILVAGGIAFVFAPSIAIALAGDAGLHGAALVSSSLAAVGGGSLAAGGLGMAGGTAIITGGGAIVGMLGGTGASAVTTLNLLNQDSYVLSECCKLLAFCSAILIKSSNGKEKVTNIELLVRSRIIDIDTQLATFKEESEKNKEQNKGRIKTAEKSLKYLKRCDESLKKLIEMVPTP